MLAAPLRAFTATQAEHLAFAAVPVGAAARADEDAERPE